MTLLNTNQKTDAGGCYFTPLASIWGGEPPRMINFASDLHISSEGISSKFFIKNPGKTLIIAGDIGPVRFWGSDTYQRFFEGCSKHWENVIIVAGNHEHYDSGFFDTIDLMKKSVEGLQNIHVLEKETIEIDGVLFVCATLWTDFCNENLDVIDTASTRMNDYYRIRSREKKKPISPFVTLNDHREALKFIKTAVAENQLKKVVVVTHHAPSFKSITPYYASLARNINFAYYTDLEYIMEANRNISHWIHGHCHTRASYKIADSVVSIHARGVKNQFPDWDHFKPSSISV